MQEPREGTELTVPGLAGRHFIVEFPGYVANQDAVLATLGGLEGIARQLQDNAAMLPLRLRPEDAVCHPIHGERHRTSCLILKLSRPKKQQQQQQQTDPSRSSEGSDTDPSGSQGGEYTAQIIATADAVYKFTNPADYQYVGRDQRPLEVRTAATAAPLEQGPRFLPPEPLLCAPPLFAKQQGFDYAFGAMDSKLGATGRDGKKFSISIGFFSPATEVPLALEQPPEVREPLKPLQQHIWELLAKRPIWLGASMHAASPENTPRTAIDELMPRLCYRFKNGPWKHAWVRKGYDPRLDPEARKYQVTEYQLPSEWYYRVGRQKQGKPDMAVVLPPLATNYNDLVKFTAVPNTHSTFLHLCDLQDSEIETLLAQPTSYQDQCSDATGWMQPAAWESLKKRVRARFLAVLEETATAAEQQQQQQNETAMDIDTAETGTTGTTAGGVVIEKEQQGGAQGGGSAEEEGQIQEGVGGTQATRQADAAAHMHNLMEFLYGAGGALDSRLGQVAADALLTSPLQNLHLGARTATAGPHLGLGIEGIMSPGAAGTAGQGLSDGHIRGTGEYSDDEGGAYTSEEEGYDDGQTDEDDYAESEDE